MNISLITLALSPIYLSTILEATIFKNFAYTLQAKALYYLLLLYLAIKVLPVPGGPYIKQPLGGLTPTLLNNSGLVMGNSIVYSLCYEKYFS